MHNLLAFGAVPMEPKRRRVAATVRIADDDGVCSQGRRQGEHIFAAGEIPGGASKNPVHDSGRDFTYYLLPQLFIRDFWKVISNSE